MNMGQIMAECDCHHTACKMRGYCMAARIAELEAENARLRDETAAAVAAERESCAHICDVETASRLEDGRNAALKIRSLIRARAALDKDRAS